MKTKRNTNATRLDPTQHESAPLDTLRPLLLGACITLALVAGCSSDDDDDGVLPDGTGGSGASMVGVVSLEVEGEDDAPETGLNALFIRFIDTTISGGYLDALDTVLSGSDVCFVSEESDEDDVLDLDFDLDLGETISAGQILTFTSLAGTYATLERISQPNPLSGDTFTVYQQPGDSLAGLPPTGLTLDIPGDVFPAFSNVAVPDVPAPLIDFSPAIGSAASNNTVFNWTPSGVTGATISLGLESDAESIDCRLADDGDFTLPDSVTSQIVGTFNGTVDDADRDSTVVVTMGDAALLIAAEDTRVD